MVGQLGGWGDKSLSYVHPQEDAPKDPPEFPGLAKEDASIRDGASERGHFQAQSESKTKSLLWK